MENSTAGDEVRNIGADNEELLKELNNVEAQKYIGGVVFVAIIMVLGFVGNIHVLIVYTFRMKPSNHRIFILMLACLDFTTCSVGMPFILFDLRNPWTFTMEAACKVLRFINYFICISSALLLVVIAVDRYRKICVPLGKQMSTNVAKLLCLIVLVTSSLLSWPAPVLYGHDTVEIPGHNVTGTRCYIVDKYKPTKYMAYFNIMLILIVLIVVIVLAVLYFMIWRAIRRHSVALGKTDNSKGEQSSTATATQDTTELSMISNSTVTTKWYDEMPTTLDMNEKDKLTPIVSSKHVPDSQKAKNDNKKFNRAKRTTLMFLLITVVFVISYFPHLSLKIVTFLNKNFVPNMSFTGLVFYNTFIWCFFINNMANAFIYGFFDTRFRDEVKAMYQQRFWRRK